MLKKAKISPAGRKATKATTIYSHHDLRSGRIYIPGVDKRPSSRRSGHYKCPAGHPLFASVNVEHRLVQKIRTWLQTSSVSEVQVYCSDEDCRRVIPERTKNLVWRAIERSGALR